MEALHNRPFSSSPRPLYQNKVKCSAFDVEMIFHSLVNETLFHKKGCALGLMLEVRVFGTWKWPNVAGQYNDGIFQLLGLYFCFSFLGSQHRKTGSIFGDKQ